MKLTDDMADSTPLSDHVGATSSPDTDAERGASNTESPQQSVETRFFVAGTSVILKGLPTVQCNGRVGKVLPQRAAATQERIPLALINGTKLSVKPTNLKVEDDPRPDDSMPPLPQAANDALSDESLPLWEHAGIKPVGAKADEDAASENSMPSLEDDGNKTPSISKQENSGVGGPTFTFNQSRAAGDGNGALEDVGKEIPTQSAEKHSIVEGTKVILKGLTALQLNGQVGKMLKNCRTASTHDRIPAALMNGHKLRVKITNL